jgi:hypothetical protein
MAFIKHVGKHGDRKVAVVFREVPGEPHMALVVYTELLNRSVHDPLINCINSDIGQHSENLADALNRSYTTDGQIILQKLHAEGMLKKVNTETIVMTPAPNVQIKLVELNKILDEMEKGEEAVKRLAEMDKQLGMQDTYKAAKSLRESVNRKDAFTPETIPLEKRAAFNPLQGSDQALGDASIAQNLRSQATRMLSEANGLLAEAKRLNEEANQLDPSSNLVTENATDSVKKKKPSKKTSVSV